jgi:hypothetical protein
MRPSALRSHTNASNFVVIVVFKITKADDTRLRLVEDLIEERLLLVAD